MKKNKDGLGIGAYIFIAIIVWLLVTAYIDYQKCLKSTCPVGMEATSIKHVCICAVIPKER